MPSLQIRDVPPDVYEALAARANAQTGSLGLCAYAALTVDKDVPQGYTSSLTKRVSVPS